MNTINYIFDNFSFWELLVYALMYGLCLLFLIGGVITLVRFVKDIIADSKFAKL